MRLGMRNKLLAAALLGAAIASPALACKERRAGKHELIPGGDGAVVFTPKGRLDGSAVTELKLYERSHAVVIGVDRYQKMPRLHAAERDAEELARVLGAKGFAVEKLLGSAATREAVVRVLGDELPGRVGPRDRVLVYFAGHGLSSGEGESAVGYLLPADGDPEHPAATSVPMTELVRWFGEYPAKHVMLLADACYSGLALSTRSVGLRPAMERYLEAITRRPVRVVFVAGGGREEAHEWQGRGLFTHFVLRALDGAADSNRDGIITSDEIVAYVKPEVSVTAQRLWGANQHPQSGRSGEGELVFVSPLGAELPSGKAGLVAGASMAGAQGPAEPERSATAPPKVGPVAENKPATSAGNPPPAPLPKGYVRIEAGSFVMGTPKGRHPRDGDEHTVRVDVGRPFLLGVNEVTQGQWQAVMGNNPSTFVGCGKDCPVEELTFFDALAFANALSRHEGLPECYELRGCARLDGESRLACQSARFAGVGCLGYRLPTEEEWEYAARAGTSTATYAGDLEISKRRRAPALDAIAWHGGNNAASYAGAMDCGGWEGRRGAEVGCGTNAVGRLEPNPWGLHDMLGNVWEWVWTRPDPTRGDYGAASTAAGARRVCRGCGWYNDARDCRAANRFFLAGHHHFFNVGLRLARTLPE